MSSDGGEGAPDERDVVGSHSDADDQADGEDNMGQDAANLTGRKKKLFELRLKMVIANMILFCSFRNQCYYSVSFSITLLLLRDLHLFQFVCLAFLFSLFKKNVIFYI